MSDPFRNSDGGFGGYAGINQQNINHNPSPVDIQDRYGSIDHQGPIQKKSSRIGSQNGLRPDIGNAGASGSRGFSAAQPPPEVLAAQLAKFPPAQGRGGPPPNLPKPRVASSRPAQGATRNDNGTLRPPAHNQGRSGGNFNASRSSLGHSRKSDRKNQMNNYEQMFFSNSKGMTGFQNLSQPNLPVPQTKNSQVVDLRGYGYTPERQTQKFQ